MGKNALLLLPSLLPLLFINSCSHPLNNFNKQQNASCQGTDDQLLAPLVENLGGSLPHEAALSDYLYRVLSRLNTLTAFREKTILIELVASSKPLAFYFQPGRLILSRGLLTCLHSEAELVASSIAAMMNPIVFNCHQLPLVLALLERGFPSTHDLISQSKTIEEILISLGYSPLGLPYLIAQLKQQAPAPSQERIDGGYLGEATYQKMISPLMELKLY